MSAAALGPGMSRMYVQQHARVPMYISIKVSRWMCMSMFVCLCVWLHASRQTSLSSVVSIICLVVHDQSVLDKVEAV